VTATTHVLKLNADYRPIEIISWEDAILLILDEKADLVVGYVGEVIRSVSLTFERPAVVRLRQFVALEGRVRFNRRNVLARDGFVCAYCGLRPRRDGGPDLERLTIDHVIPRAQSKHGRVFLPWSRRYAPVTCWENVVTACEDCNGRKADRTPAQAGLTLARYPRVPSAGDVLRMSLTRVRIPEEWKDFLPEGSEWRDYWTVDLSED
jgi:5-methylcytosine-specific restriction endonuclease McrA